MESAIKKHLPDSSIIKANKIKVKFDIHMLECIIGFIYKDSKLRSRKVLKNIRTLFDIIDESVYINDVDLYSRFWVIQRTLDVIFIDGFENESVIITKLMDDPKCDESITQVINHIAEYKTISYEESKYIIKAIDDRLQFGYSLTVKELYEDIFSQFDEEGYKTYKELQEDIYQLSATTVNIRRHTNGLNTDQEFSLKDDVFETVVSDA